MDLAVVGTKLDMPWALKELQGLTGDMPEYTKQNERYAKHKYMQCHHFEGLEELFRWLLNWAWTPKRISMHEGEEIGPGNTMC